jgi:predicted transport protein
MILISNNQKYVEYRYRLESELEKDVVNHAASIFGAETVYIDAKRKIGTGALGNSIPDGFLFDLSEPAKPEFYLVEMELASHDFYNHIFPQITKFFAFLKNEARQRELVEKIFTLIQGDGGLKSQFKKYLGDAEIFRFLNDVVADSQNILLLIDGSKPELPEIMATYTDTWGKMIKILTVKKYLCNGDMVLSVEPEFESIEYESPVGEEEADSEKPAVFSEEDHLKDVTEPIKAAYEQVRHALGDLCSFKATSSYIACKKGRNFAFIRVRRKKIWLTTMLPETQVRQIIRQHQVSLVLEHVQKSYYNSANPLADILITGDEHIDEIIAVMKAAMEFYGKG